MKSFRENQFRLLCLVTVVVPLAALIVAVGLVWGRGVGPAELATCCVMFLLTLIGIEVGFHRHFSHRSFKAVTPVRHMLAALGSMAFQGKLIWWVGIHRTHHQFSDRPGDPHSPVKGLLMAHVGWIFNNVNPLRWTRRVKDLLHDPIAITAHRLYFFWFAVGLILPGVVVALATQSWMGLFSGMLWGGLVRIFLVNHVVWSINSICHHYGSQPFNTHDEARNNYWLLLPSMGFSLHNNHHAFPYAAINARAWWQLDLCGLFIRLLERLGLVWDIREPSPKDDTDKIKTRGFIKASPDGSSPIAVPNHH